MAKACIGLDLGSSAVKLVQVGKARGGGFELLSFGIEPIPSDSIVDGTIMNQSSVVEAVRTLYQRLRLKRKDVALAIAGHSVIIKKIAVAPMAPKDLEEQIPWEAEQHIPFAKDDVEIDYHPLETRTPQGQMEVLLVAAKKEVVRDFAAVAREAQLNPVVVDIAAFALQNAFEAAYPVPPADQAVVLINVGAHTSNINIVSAGVPAFTRDIDAGSALLTEDIRRVIAVTFEEAEALKLDAADEAESGSPDLNGETTGALVLRLAQQRAEEMAGELVKSLDFFLSTNPDKQVSQIYLSGGGARSPFLREAIARRAHVAVELMDPFRQMEIKDASNRVDRDLLRSSGAQAAIATGLAMRSAGDKFK